MGDPQPKALATGLNELTAVIEAYAGATGTDPRPAHTAGFRLIFDSLPVGVAYAVTHPDGTLTRIINDTHLRICGLTREQDQIPNIYGRLHHPDDAARQAEFQRQVEAGERDEYTMEKRYVRLDGRVVWVVFSFRRRRAGGGFEDVTTVVDITEQKQAEAALHQSREEFKDLFDNAPLGYHEVDTEGRLTRVNATELKMLGYSEVELLGQFVWKISGEEPVSREAVLAKLAGEPPTPAFERRLRRKDGSTFPALIEDRIMRNEAGRITGIRAVVQDIGRRKLAEEELRWKTAFLEAQVNASPDGILVVDSQNKRIQQNRRLLDLFHVPREIAEDDDDTLLLRHVTAQMKNPQQFLERVKHLYAHPDEIGRDEIELERGTVLDRYSSPVRDGAGKYYGRIWAFRDITERRKLEAQFRQTQKMEGIGQLAGGVAHDFNNILAVIQMQAELLAADELTAEQAECAHEIGVTVQRAAALTRQLLLFSRREVFQPRELDLNESIADTTKMLKRILGENIEMQLKLPSRPMYLRADPAMMDQILLNLVVNARDAMPNGGQVFIETASVDFDEAALAEQPAQARAGSFVCLSVSDTGTGIAPGILPKIFEPFFTTKDVGKGTGLGLATVFGIVQQHQGWIQVVSEVGLGSTFKIYLPRLARHVQPEAVPSALSVPQGGSETLLLVEDDPTLRVSVQKALAQRGYRVLAASTGVKALEVWRQNCADIRLLLTDLVMPDGMSGKDLAERLLREEPKLRVIYMSGYSAEVAGTDFPLNEGVNFLSKPFQVTRLVETVRNCLDKG